MIINNFHPYCRRKLLDTFEKQIKYYEFKSKLISNNVYKTLGTSIIQCSLTGKYERLCGCDNLRQ